MKKSSFTEEQIAYVLRQAEAGTSVSNVCRAATSAASRGPYSRTRRGGATLQRFGAHAMTRRQHAPALAEAGNLARTAGVVCAIRWIGSTA